MKTNEYRAMKETICGLAILLASLAAALLSGCGGSGAGGDLTASGGIGGSGVTVGSVSKFGSVFVNGIEFDTSDAEIVVDGVSAGTGDPAARTSLAVGMRVRVEGPFAGDGEGRAARVVYNEDVVGPVGRVEDLGPETLLLTVLGQAVVVDRGTELSGLAFEAIAVGQVLEVSGPRDDAGRILASFVRKRADAYAAGDPVEVRGNATAVDRAMRTFRVGELTIDYSLADLDGLAGADPAEGELLEVKGVLEASGVLLASTVGTESLLGTADAEEASVSGIVTRFSTIASFEVAGVPVVTDAQTRFLGILPEEIGAGTGLLVTGQLASGVLLADTVRPTAPAKVESDVEGVDGEELSLAGLPGLAVAATDLTRIVGQGGSFEEILPGDHVKAYGTAYTAGRVVASKIVVQKNPKPQVALRGPVGALSGATIEVLGVEIDTTGIPDEGFSLEEGGPLSRAEFLGRLRVGDTVNLNGTLAGATVTWRTIALANAN